MKGLKIVAVIMVGVVALVALLAAVALTSPVQTWAVRKAVAGQTGFKLEVGRVAAGLSSADLRDVRFVQNGMVVTATHATATYSAWDYLTHRRVVVDGLDVDGLVVDMRAVTPSPAESGTATNRTAKPNSNGTSSPSGGTSNAQTPFKGVLSQIQLPFDVRVTRFAVPGRVLLPDQQTATFDLRGSNVQTGQRGTVDWKAELTNAQPNAAWTALHTSGTVALHITTERRIDVAEINALADVVGPKLPADQLALDVKAEQPAAGGNEGYTVNLALVRTGRRETLAHVAAQYDANSHAIAGAWTVTARTEQLAAVLSGFGLPEIALDGAGKFTAQPDTAAVTASGELRSDISHLEKVSPELAPIGSLRVQTKFDGALSDNVARLEQFTLDATTADGRRLAQVNTLQRIAFSLADKRVSFADAKAELARISVQALPLAWAQPFTKPLAIESGALSLVLAVTAEADGSRVRVQSVEPLALRDVTVRQGEQRLADHLTLTVEPQADYSADRLQAELRNLNIATPVGDSITGKITADITQLSRSPAIAFTSAMQGRIVAALKPYLPLDPGPLSFTTTTDGNFAGQNLQVHHATTTVTRATGAPLLAFALQQPYTLNLQTNTITTANPEATTAQVKLGEVPLAWAEAFVANAKFSGNLTGATLAIGLRSLDHVTVSTTEPLTLRGVGAVMNGQPMAQGLDVTLDFSAAKQGDAIRYDVRRLELKQAAASLASVVVSGDVKLGAKVAIAAKGTLDADAAALMQQPAAAAFATLSRGKISGSFDAAIADTIRAAAKISARNLTARQNNQPLGDADLTLTATVQSDGTSVVNVPFTLTAGGRKSDVLLDGKIGRTAAGVSFDGKLTSNQIFVDDFQAFASLAPASKPTTAAPTTPAPATTASTQNGRRSPAAAAPATPGSTTPKPASPTRDTQPFWSGAQGGLIVDLKQITYGRDYIISGVRGAASITPAQLALSSLEGRFKENPFKVTAGIGFDARKPQPYSLNGSANVANLDIGEILRAANPNEKPQLETKVTVIAQLNGQGATLPDLAMNAYGKFDVTGSKGVLRALSRKGGQAVSVGSSIIGLIGAARGSDTTVAVAELARELEEMAFDKFTMHVERGADLNLKISQVEFISPATRVTGSGGITNQPGVPIQNQPLRFELSLAGKEHMAVLLNKAGLLSGQQDADGYYMMNTSFTLTGTPAKPDSKDLWRIIGEATVRAAAGALLR